MGGQLTIRFMRQGEEDEVFALVSRVFDEFIAGDFSPEGVEEFYRYAAAEALAERWRQGNRVLVAEWHGRMGGMLELKGSDHIAMLFVEERGRGLGRGLVERALRLCRQDIPDLAEVGVNASLYAVPIYRRLGFREAGPRRTENGLTFVPMTFRFDSSA
jgi:GNAT superfamily N-acetyltransferase